MHHAGRHARRLGVPVTMATQAGSTEDEDFPGLAALILPSGEIARLPDWRPGSLIVDVGTEVTVHPTDAA
jgi:predicted amidohydrolase